MKQFIPRVVAQHGDRSGYERASIVLTSNRDRAEWPDLFGEALLASAALDRLTHGGHFVEITGASFRAEATKKQTTARRGRTPDAKAAH